MLTRSLTKQQKAALENPNVTVPQTDNMSDARAQKVLEESGCGGLAGAIESCFKGITYVICCCGCCTSYEDFYDGFGE